MAFDKKNLAVIEKEIIAALADVAKRHGITVHFNGGRFEPLEANLKLVLKTTGDDGSTAEAERYNAHRGMYGLPPLKTAFETMGRKGLDVFTIVGMHRTKDRSILAASKRDGKSYCFYPHDVARLTKIGIVPKESKNLILGKDGLPVQNIEA